MTVKSRCIFNTAFAANTPTALTLTTNASSRVIIDKFTASNRTGSTATFTAYIAPSADAGDADASEEILPPRSIAPGESYHCPELVGHTLEPGDVIFAGSDTASAIVIRASGREVIG